LLAAAVSIAICSPAAYSANTAHANERMTASSSPQLIAARDAETVYRSAMEKYNANDLQGALVEFDELIRLQPDFAAAYVNRGNIKDDLGNPQGALEDYTKALSLDDKDHSTYFNRGITYSRLEKYKEAITDFQKSISLKADYAPAHRGLGVAKYYGSTDKAVKRSGIADIQKAASLYKQQGDDAKAQETSDIAQKFQESLG
jgi:tetratricopeptide (TPR) repeat protein